jgi:hypothetical protein
MREVAGDVTHSLLHLDSRAWQTLKLLILRPGELTREFIAGRHQDYLPPFRFYLGISILFFALSALLPDKDLVHLEDDGQAVTAPVTGKPPGNAAHDPPDEVSAELSQHIRGELTKAGVDPAPAEDLPKSDGEDCDIDLTLPLIGSVGEPLGSACRKIAADGGVRLFEHFANIAPRLMFLFLPLMAAVTLLFYWRRPQRLYVEHLVLFLHSHAFIYLLLAATVVTGALSAIELPLFGFFGFLTFILYAYLPYYVFRSMRVVYGESRQRTLLKFTALSTIYFILLGATMLAGFVYTALALV